MSTCVHNCVRVCVLLCVSVCVCGCHLSEVSLYSDGLMQKDVTPRLTHWGYVFLTSFINPSIYYHGQSCGALLDSESGIDPWQSPPSHSQHDDVIKWKHFPRYWPFVRGIHRSPVNSPHKGQWRGALMFSLICTRINGLSKQSWGWWFETPSRPLWRHCN